MGTTKKERLNLFIIIMTIIFVAMSFTAISLVRDRLDSNISESVQLTTDRMIDLLDVSEICSTIVKAFNASDNGVNDVITMTSFIKDSYFNDFTQHVLNFRNKVKDRDFNVDYIDISADSTGNKGIAMMRSSKYNVLVKLELDGDKLANMEMYTWTK